MTTQNARTQKKQRTGGVSIVGRAKVQIEVQRLIEIVCLVKLKAFEGHTRKIGAKALFQPFAKFLRIVLFDLRALDTGIMSRKGFGNIAGENAYRSYPGYAAITQDENVATGDYNGLQSAVRIQNRWGLSGEVDYTYSHQIDIQSQDRNEIDNPWYIKYDKGSGSYDRRQILNADYVYNLPIFNKSQGLVKSIAGGWQIAGTFVKETGIPQEINISAAYDPVGLGGGYNAHPSMTPGGKLNYPKKVTQWFDASRINNNVTPVWAGGTNLGFGNWGKDALVLPGRFNLTTSLYKSFQIHEQVNFQLKFESFNTLNHTEFNAVSTSGGNAGALTGTQDPRNLQLAGKFTF